MNRSIPFFDYPSIYSSHRENLIKVFDEISSKGAFILQDELKLFEERLASYVGSKYAIGVGNATDALELLLKAYGIEEGSEIIFSSHTMVATASAIKFSGAVPIPAESGFDHLIDVNKIEELITDKTVAIMPTQLNGRVADMDAIDALAKKYNLAIFEDSAQALGAKFRNTSAGCFGVGGCISFYPAKILGCLGDGGAVICNDEEIYKKILLLRDHGRDSSGEVTVWGFNSRLDNIQAGFLNYYMDFYEETVSRRREIASLYNERLSSLNQLILPPPPNDHHHFDVFQNYEIQAEDRDSLKNYLIEKGIGTLVQWGGKPVHQFTKLGFNQDLPATDLIFTKLLMLPINLSISNEDIEYVCEAVTSFYDR
jgi:dTDP-4-amino-4,6-dideoxygalactose transaminase